MGNGNAVVLGAGRGAAELDVERALRSEADVATERHRAGAWTGSSVALEEDSAGTCRACTREGTEEHGRAQQSAGAADLDAAVVDDIVEEIRLCTAGDDDAALRG